MEDVLLDGGSGFNIITKSIEIKVGVSKTETYII